MWLRDYLPRHNWLSSGHYALGFEDLITRIHDVAHVRAGVNLYSPHDHHQYFTYPPAALLLFWPLSWFAARVDVVWWTVLNLLALSTTIGVTWRAVRPTTPLSTIAAGTGFGALVAVALFPVISIGVAVGQLGLLIACALTLDFLVVPPRYRGILTGIVAAIKVYPLVFVIVWLARRDYRAAGTAVASAATVTGVAWALWPSATATFIHRQLFGGHELTHFWHSAHWLSTSSSPYTIFFRSPFGGGNVMSVLGWLASLSAVALGVWAATRLWRSGLKVSALVAALAASILAGPVTWDHYYTFAPLMVVVAVECWPRRALVAAALGAAVIYAVPWQLARNESLSLHGFSARAVLVFVARNALSAATLAFVVVAVRATRSGRNRAEETVAPLAQ